MLFLYVFSVLVIILNSQGVTFPAMHAMFGKWAPVMERSQLTALAYSGISRVFFYSNTVKSLYSLGFNFRGIRR